MIRGAHSGGAMVSCAVVAMMMMMMAVMMSEVAAMPKGRESRRSSAHVHTVPLHLDPVTFTPTAAVRLLHNVSISPWTYNVSRDDNVFPPLLSEARCLLKGCLNEKGQEDQNLSSQPIMHQVLVLRRIRAPGEGNEYHYRLESRLLAVGCTCVRQAFVTQE